MLSPMILFDVLFQIYWYTQYGKKRFPCIIPLALCTKLNSQYRNQSLVSGKLMTCQYSRGFIILPSLHRTGRWRFIHYCEEVLNLRNFMKFEHSSFIWRFAIDSDYHILRYCIYSLILEYNRYVVTCVYKSPVIVQ